MESYCNILHYLGGNGRAGVEYLSFIMEVFVNDHTSYSRSCTDVYEAIMVGDSYDADILGAVNAGINAILLRKENSHNYKQYCENLVDIFEFL